MLGGGGWESPEGKRRREKRSCPPTLNPEVSRPEQRVPASSRAAPLSAEGPGGMAVWCSASLKVSNPAVGQKQSVEHLKGLRLGTVIVSAACRTAEAWRCSPSLHLV